MLQREATNMDPKASPFLLFLISLFLLSLWRQSASAEMLPMALPNCPSLCGNVSIPYPFGIGADCSRDANFTVYCNKTSSPPKAYLFSSMSNLRIHSISLSVGELRVFNAIARACYNSSGGLTNSRNGWVNLTKYGYRFSHRRNKYTVIGCNALALVNGEGDTSYKSGCASICLREENVEEEICSGLGCCQTTITEGLTYYNVSFYHFPSLDTVRSFNPCSYAFIAEEGWHTFRKPDLNGMEFFDRYHGRIPLVLDWAIGSENCTEAGRNSSPNACVSENSICLNGTYGYICNCSVGYEGNPYLVGGCYDVDECKQHDACPPGQTCINLQGNHRCECPKGTKLDTNTNACLKKPFPALPLALGVSTGFFLLAMLGSWLYWGLHKRKIILSRQNFFEQNGGLLLKRQISSQSEPSFKIYTVEQIEKATNKFNEVLGQGGQGTVYKGIFSNGVVAIKKSRSIEESQRSEFAKEMLILSQINHRHVVKLLGCCLEVDIPMLVYEFISGGTLFNRLHGPEKRSMPFVERLTVAIQSASALSYLHADASPSIVHGDVKSANILLDDKLEAKISDFGASKLAPMDKDKFATVVQGTYGYLDPESLQTYQLTAKSDVYSFGVVLAELITRKTPLYGDDPQKQHTLALDFVASEKNGQLISFLDQQIVNVAHVPCLHDVAKLTSRCLSIKGDDRPTMKEVMTELEGIRSLVLALGPGENVDEAEPLLGQQTIFYENNTSTYTHTHWEKSAFNIGGR